MNSIDEELIDSARENNLPEAHRLLSVGADVNAKDNYGATALYWASENGHVQVAKLLLEHGADIEAKDTLGDTPLHIACLNGHVAFVNELLSRRANTEAKTFQGSTPLHLTSMYGHLPVVKALVSGGANILVANNQDSLPVHYAVSEEHSAVAKYLLQQMYARTPRLPLHELLHDLTWIGEDPNGGSAPPLWEALYRNVLGTDDVVEILEYLVGRKPALLSSRDQDNSLPLHVACRRGAFFPIVHFLVKCYKASVKSVTSEGDLPLFLACELPETSLGTIFLLMKLYPDLVYR
jgi:ankyrin repeat protein